MPILMQVLIDSLKENFNSSRNTEYAVRMKSYMKDHFEFYGIQSTPRRKIVYEAWKKYKIRSLEEMEAFTSYCWDQSEREWQYTAMDIMDKCKKHYDETTVTFAERLIKTKSWWDTVDWIASNMVGTVLLKFPYQRDEHINQWMASGNIWLQRTCLIFQLKYREKTDFELMTTLIYDLRGSREFFIQKGAGWALRQYSKFRPDLVKSFITANPDLSNLTKREGLKYC